MENSKTRDASATPYSQEVRNNAKIFLQIHPRIPLSRFAADTGWLWSYTATLVPTRWIFISHSFIRMYLKLSQVDAEIEVGGENEKELDSKEAETEVPKCQTYVFL